MYLLDINKELQIIAYEVQVSIDGDEVSVYFMPFVREHEDFEGFVPTLSSNHVCDFDEVEYVEEEEYAVAHCKRHNTTLTVRWWTGTVDFDTDVRNFVDYGVVNDRHCLTLLGSAATCLRGLVKACEDAKNGDQSTTGWQQTDIFEALEEGERK